MTNTQIKRILDQHSIPNYESGNHIFADSMISGTAIYEQVVDLTGITKSVSIQLPDSHSMRMEKDLFPWIEKLLIPRQAERKPCKAS
jgi:hypothetical protein